MVQRTSRWRPLKRLAGATCLAAASLAASASPAAASVTIGQLSPESEPGTTGSQQLDIVQPTVTSGNAYVVPGNGTITSWSHNPATGPNQTLTMKIFRPLGALTFMVVGHDGPRNLTGFGVINTFPASIAVKPGDVLGVNSGMVETLPDNASVFSAPGDSSPARGGDLADGASDAFGPGMTDSRVNATAVFVPSNGFTLGKLKRNKKKGTATLTVEDLPNTGELVLSGKGVKPATGAGAGAVVAKTVTAPGDVKLKIRAKGKKKRKLNETGKVKVKPKVTYTPTGGDPATESRKVKLRKR